MIITSKKELNNYQKICNLSTKLLDILRQSVKAGIYPIELDKLAYSLCQKHKVKPAFLGVPGKLKPFPYSTCISINDTVVHGVPSKTKRIKKGDIVKLDFGIIKDNLYTDHCFTVSVGKPSKKNKQLITTAKKAVYTAARKAITNATVGDLSSTMHSIALSRKFDVLKKYTGHGIGHALHEPPIIPSHGQAGSGPILKTGMVLCIEAQLVTGSDQTYVAKDGWSVKMKDHGKTAMFEYMVVVQPKKPIFLTNTVDWPFVV